MHALIMLIVSINLTLKHCHALPLHVDESLMKSPADASMRMDGVRHQNGMQIESNTVKVQA